MKLLSKKVFGNPNAKPYDYVIAICTFGNYSHTELRFSDGQCFSSSFTRGVRYRTPIDTSNPKSWEVIDLDIDEAKARLMCNKYVGMKYDKQGAILSAIKKCRGLLLKQNENKMFCSEVCGEVIRECGKPLDKGCKYSPTRLTKTIKRLFKI